MTPADLGAVEALERTVEEHRRRKIRGSAAPLLPDEVEINPYPIHATSWQHALVRLEEREQGRWSPLQSVWREGGLR
jgi:hypothetical protein